MEVSAPDGDLGPRIDIWAPDTGLDPRFEVRVLGWSFGPWHEGLGPECRSEPLREGWILGWRSESRLEVWEPNTGFWVLDSGFMIRVLGWNSGPWHEDLGPGVEVWARDKRLCPGERDESWDGLLGH